MTNTDQESDKSSPPQPVNKEPNKEPVTDLADELKEVSKKLTATTLKYLFHVLKMHNFDGNWNY